jgi:hypothetical protein
MNLKQQLNGLLILHLHAYLKQAKANKLFLLEFDLKNWGPAKNAG